MCVCVCVRCTSFWLLMFVGQRYDTQFCLPIQKYIKMQFIHVINWIHLFHYFIIIYMTIYLYYFITMNLPLRYIYKRWSTQNWSSVIIYSTSFNLFHKPVCICFVFFCFFLEWNDMRAIKWWQKLNFWIIIPFNIQVW